MIWTGSEVTTYGEMKWTVISTYMACSDEMTLMVAVKEMQAPSCSICVIQVNGRVFGTIDHGRNHHSLYEEEECDISINTIFHQSDGGAYI